MSKYRELIKNTIIIGLGKVSTQLITFLLLPLYTLFLTPAEYGTVDLIVTYVALLVPAVTLQLEMASFRFLIDARNDEARKKIVISNVLRMILPILLVSAFGFGIIASLLSIPYAAFIAPIVAATIFSNLFLQFARGLGENKKFSIASIATGLTILVTSVWFVAFSGLGVNGLLASIAVSNLVCALYLFFALKLWRYIGIGNNDTKLQKELVGYSLPLIPNGVSWWVINVSDRTIITLFLGAAANGIYAVANKYSAIFSSIFSIFNMSWTESASVHINSKDRDAFFSQVSNATVRIFGSLGILLIAIIPLIFPLLVGSEFNESYNYIPILIVGAFFNAIVGLYSAVYIAKRMTKQVMNTSLVAAGINIVLTITLIPFIGIYAAAISTAVAFLAMAVFRHFDIKKFVKVTYEKYLFVVLGLLYALIIELYYVNNFATNIVALVIAVIASLVLNKKAFRLIKTKILGFMGNKNPSSKLKSKA